jgi:SNF2 family DNA or RNA helicase
VTRATLVERVVTLLESKRGLAAKVLAAADETWITELDDRSLREFLTLGETGEET